MQAPAGALSWASAHAWLLCAAAAALAAVKLRTAAADLHKRGARVLRGRERARYLRRRRPQGAGRLSLAGVSIEHGEETKHFKMIGTTGTGKTTVISSLLDGALGRGDRAVVTDPDGGYRARFYDRRRGDIILNPFEVASVRWDPFAEIEEFWDIEQLVAGLIPSTEDASGREWRGYARTFLTALLRSCWLAGAPDLTEFWRLLTMASCAELRPVVAGSPAQPFLDPENARMFGSIRAVAVSAASTLEHVANQRARSFSVRRWVRDGHGVLFMPYAATQIAALRAVIAMWVRLAIFEALNGAGRDLRMWFVVDELDALGAIDGLKDAIVRLRKCGGRCVLGFQAIAQVTSTYGQDGQTIIENCANTVIFRCSSSEQGGTAQFASRLIGDREVIRRQTARGRDRGGLFSPGGSRRSSTNTSEQHVTEAAVLAAELEQLPDLCGYVKTASSPAWVPVRLTIRG